MKKYIVEKQMTNNTDGFFTVVVQGEVHVNRTVIKSDIQFFTTQGGYSYCHPEQDAKQNAQAIANGLNELERLKTQQNKQYPEYKVYHHE